MNWQDVTTYSRGDEERIPSIWHCNLGHLVISVHRHIHYPKDMWLLSCEPLFIRRELKNKNINKAKREALRKVKKELKLAINAFKRKKK